MAGNRSGSPCTTSGPEAPGRFIVGPLKGTSLDFNNASTEIIGFADPLPMRFGKEPKHQASIARRVREVLEKV
jgi:hypothetical protein